MLKLAFVLFSAVRSLSLDDITFITTYDASELGTLVSEGYLVLSNALDFELVTNLSTELADCAKSGDLDLDILRSTVMDGSLRATFASDATAVNDFSFCGPSVGVLVELYKQRTQEIGISVAKLLDSMIGFTLGESEINLLEQEVKNVDSATLDHFHVYTAEGIPEDSKSLPVPFHVDMGLFLILAPAVHVGGDNVGHAASSSGLLIKKQDGSVFELEAREPNSVIILLGSGIVNWMHKGSLSHWRPALHAVKPTRASVTRVVLARMFLPNMQEEVSGVKFGDFFHQADSVDSKWRRLSDENCTAGEKYCWMQCLEEPICGDGIESVCTNNFTGDACGGDDCDCNLTCPDPPTTLNPTVTYRTTSSDTTTPTTSPSKLAAMAGTKNAFCKGATSMVMSGFQSVGSDNAYCIILFFQPWLLDTPLKFAFGCIGMILLGILVEAIIKARRLLTNSKKIESRFLKDTLVTLLFAINITLGYLCMLAAMTFNVEIFVCTVLGLAIGHVALGNIHQPVRESADACCVSSEPTVPVTTSLRNSTGACCCNEA